MSIKQEVFAKRPDPRYLTRIAIFYGTYQKKILTDYSINLSTGGVFIESGNFLPVDTQLRIEFIMPGEEEIIECNGKVAWINHPDMKSNPNLPVGMGMQFLNMSLDNMNAVRKFITKEALVPFQ